MTLIRTVSIAAGLLVLLAAGPSQAQQLQLPQALLGSAAVLGPNDRGYDAAILNGTPQHPEWASVKPPGAGGISQGILVRLTRDIPVYRLWNGPNAQPDNRLGRWWSYDPPTGTVSQYRTNYEICGPWNNLAYVATCTLRQGTVVAVGPGQSVSAATCDGQAPLARKEAYPPNPRDWQVFIPTPTDNNTLACPNADQDREVDPNNIAQTLP